MDYKTSPVSRRERFYINYEQAERFIRELKGTYNDEIFLISTCNRFGIYSLNEGVFDVLRRFCSFKGLDFAENLEYFNIYKDKDVIRHLFLLSAGLESQVVGEDQILGQIRGFYNILSREGFLKGILGELVRKSLRFGKKVRRDVYKRKISVVSRINRILRELNKPLNILILGSGNMAMEIFYGLNRDYIERLYVMSRDEKRLSQLSLNDTFAITPKDLKKVVKIADVIISATYSEEYIIRPEHIGDKRNLVIIDLGVPRTVSPYLKSIVKLYDIDDFKVNTFSEGEINFVKNLAERETEKFVRWLKERKAYPFIKEIKDYIENLSKSELEKFSKNPEMVVHRVLGKILHNVFTKMKFVAKNYEDPEGILNTISSIILPKPMVIHKRKRIIVGSRGSLLALSQTKWVIKKLQQYYPDIHFDIRIIKTSGDSGKVEGKGAFVREIQEKLLNGEIDMAVHSLKDLPPLNPEGLIIASIPKRESASDVLITKSGYKLKELPSGAKLGTSSPRRKAQIKALREDIEIVDLRGNIDTRIKRVMNGDLDGIILAKAGIGRLGLSFMVSEEFDVEDVVPAPGQGALGIEVRVDDVFMVELVKPLNDFDSEICVKAERSFMREIGADCKFPVGAYARVIKDNIYLIGLVVYGDKIMKGKIYGKKDRAEELGKTLAIKIMVEYGIKG